MRKHQQQHIIHEGFERGGERRERGGVGESHDISQGGKGKRPEGKVYIYIK